MILLCYYYMSGKNVIVYFMQSATLSSLRVCIIGIIFFRLGSSRFRKVSKSQGLFRRTTAAVVTFFETVFTNRHLKLLASLKHSRYFFGVGESSHTYRLDVRPASLLLQWTNDLQLVRRVLLARCLQNAKIIIMFTMKIKWYFLFFWYPLNFLLFKIWFYNILSQKACIKCLNNLSFQISNLILTREMDVIVINTILNKFNYVF